MKNQKNLLILLTIFAVLLIGAYVLYDNLSDNVPGGMTLQKPDTSSEDTAETSGADDTGTSSPPGEEAERVQVPDFTVTDALGNEVKLSDFEGGPVIVNFWASWCVPCQSEMPAFEEKFTEYGDEIHFMMINMTDGDRETVETAQEYITGEGYTFPVYYDTALEACINYGVTTIPATYFIDSDRYGVVRALTALDAETLQRGIDMIFEAEAEKSAE